VTEFLNQDLILFHMDCILRIALNHLLRAIVLALAASAAILSAVDLTSATRRPQPAPKTGHVLSDWRKRKRSSQMAEIRIFRSAARAAAMTASVTVRESSGNPSIRRNTLPLRPVPEFTPYLGDRVGCLSDGHAGQPQRKLLEHIVELFAAGCCIRESLADGFGEYRRADAQHPGAVANLVDCLRQKPG
jgi:hypothetical protein